jgi:hypothetical protein
MDRITVGILKVISGAEPCFVHERLASVTASLPLFRVSDCSQRFHTWGSGGARPIPAFSAEAPIKVQELHGSACRKRGREDEPGQHGEARKS